METAPEWPNVEHLGSVLFGKLKQRMTKIAAILQLGGQSARRTAHFYRHNINGVIRNLILDLGPVREQIVDRLIKRIKVDTRMGDNRLRRFTPIKRGEIRRKPDPTYHLKFLISRIKIV